MSENRSSMHCLHIDFELIDIMYNHRKDLLNGFRKLNNKYDNTFIDQNVIQVYLQNNSNLCMKSNAIRESQ